MIGQIRSYISFISPDKDDEYINRIKNMINSLDNETDKYILTLELNKKLNELIFMKKFYKTEEELKPGKVSIFNGNDSKEENVEVKEEKSDQFQQVKMMTGKYLPPIYISAYELVKIRDMKVKLQSEIYSKKKKSKVKILSNSQGIPSIPILEDEESFDK